MTYSSYSHYQKENKVNNNFNDRLKHFTIYFYIQKTDNKLIDVIFPDFLFLNHYLSVSKFLTH